MTRKRFLVFFITICTLIAIGGCGAQQPDIRYQDIQIQWLDEAYTPETIWFDNDWLQKKSLLAAEALDLQKTPDFYAYLERFEPILLRYFIRNYELTDIMHYSNGIWAVRYVLPEERICVLGSDYDVEIYYISETTGEIYNYECWSSSGTSAWE